MEYIKYTKSIKKYLNEIFFYRILILLLIILCIFLSYMNSIKDRVVIITPPNVVKDLTLHKDYADTQYLQEMGIYFSLLLGNISSKTSNYVINTLRKHMVTGLKKQIKDSLLSQISQINQNSYETNFSIYEVEFKVYKKLKKPMVFVRGIYKVYLNNEKIVDKELTYVWEFKIRDWIIYINDFITLDKSNSSSQESAIKF